MNFNSFVGWSSWGADLRPARIVFQFGRRCGAQHSGRNRTGAAQIQETRKECHPVDAGVRIRRRRLSGSLHPVRCPSRLRNRIEEFRKSQRELEHGRRRETGTGQIVQRQGHQSLQIREIFAGQQTVRENRQPPRIRKK